MVPAFRKTRFWIQVQVRRLDRLYRVHIVRMPRPNFNELEVVFQTVNMVSTQPSGNEKGEIFDMAIFPEVDGMVSQQNGWTDNIWEYQLLASLIFARRYPAHPYSKQIKEGFSDFTDEIIDQIGSGEKRLRIKRSDSGNLTVTF